MIIIPSVALLIHFFNKKENGICVANVTFDSFTAIVGHPTEQALIISTDSWRKECAVISNYAINIATSIE